MHKKNQSGLSTLEFVMAAVVLAIGLIPMLSVLIDTRKGTETREIEIIALMAGQSLYEEIASYKWDENSTGRGIYATSKSLELGPDAGETTKSTFDDLDDFAGYVDHPTNKTTRAVEIAYMDFPAGASPTPSAGQTDFKKVKITVTHQGAQNKPQVIETILINGVQ